MTDDNCLKTRVTASKLVWIDRIRWTLQAERKDICVPVWNRDLFSKKRRFSFMSQAEQDISHTIVDNCLKTSVVPPKLASFDRIRWTLHAEHKNMCASLRNKDLFSNKLRLSCFSPTEQDMLGVTEDNALITRVIPSKLTSFDRINWTLDAERKKMCPSVYVFLTYNIPNYFKLTSPSFDLFYSFK